MHYRVVDGAYPFELSGKVNALIAEGWEPQGGIISRSNGISTHYYQAMIRR